MMWCARWGEQLSDWWNGIGKDLTVCNSKDLIWRESTLEMWKTRKARSERR